VQGRNWNLMTQVDIHITKYAKINAFFPFTNSFTIMNENSARNKQGMVLQIPEYMIRKATEFLRNQRKTGQKRRKKPHSNFLLL
jgi:hypothetical protein